MTPQQLESRIRRGEIDTVLVVAPDVFGRLMGKRCTGRFFLDQVRRHGTHGCNYLLAVNLEMDPMDGFKLANWDKGFGDFAFRPDLSTARVLPWQPATAMVLCDFCHHDGALVEEAPRTVLRRRIEALAHLGYTSFFASELEFFLFDQTYRSAAQTGYQGLVPSSDYRIDYHTMQPTRDEALMRSARNGMTAAGIPIENSKGEWGKGQHEINFSYAAPLPMADMHVIFKHGMKELAEQHGKAVTFMAKYLAGEAGSSCHIHVSLWRRQRNVFWEPRHKQESKVFRQFVGGLMKYSRELAFFFAPTVNAYKRYQPSSWAPTRMAWARDNRTVGFRAVGHADSFRIENRMPGADANPYLAFAAMLAAGMAGIEEGLDCGEPYEGNAYIDSRLEALPSTLSEATTLLKQSELARKTFGEAVVEFYVHTAELEVQAFNNAITDWERKRYFEQI